jgi:exonuclease III
MVNARSLRNKTNEFLHHAITNDYDICVITETWLNNNDTAIIESLRPKGYDFQHVSRNNPNRGGGIGIFFKNQIKVKKLKSPTYSTFEMCLWNIQIKQTDLNLLALYRPPYSPKHRKTVPMFLREFSEVWSNILATYNNERLLLLGDFNIHIDISNNSDTKSFAEFLVNFDCQQHVNCQTHESGHTIDLCISPTSSILNVSTPTVDHYLSDHAFVDLLISLPKPPLVRTKFLSRAVSKTTRPLMMILQK